MSMSFYKYTKSYLLLASRDIRFSKIVISLITNEYSTSNIANQIKKLCGS